MVPMCLVHMADIARKADIRMKIYNTQAEIDAGIINGKLIVDEAIEAFP